MGVDLLVRVLCAAVGGLWLIQGLEWMMNEGARRRVGGALWALGCAAALTLGLYMFCLALAP